MATRNKTAGSNFERHHVHRLKEIGYNAVSSRQESRSLDAQKVDIVTDAPYYIQCKLTQNTPNIKHNFDAMPEGKVKVLFHGKTVKKGNRFYKDEEYAYIGIDDFYKIMKLLKDNNLDSQL